MKNSIIFSNLAETCLPAENISKERLKNKWQAIDYETPKVKGTMLSAVNGCHPQPVVLRPNLTGWYNIYIGTDIRLGGTTNFKLTDDDAAYANMGVRSPSGDVINESYWRSADMTGQELTISKYKNDSSASLVAWIRFEPMSDGEIEAYKNQFTNKKHKRLNATNDCCVFTGADFDEYKIKWYTYKESDFESISFEIPAFCRMHYGEHSLEEYKQLIDYAHELDLKLFISLRMGLWGAPYPTDGAGSYSKENPQWRCIDRDGGELIQLSYAYEGVQDFAIEKFLKYVPLGCDAVELLFNRGVPYVLFEDAFCNAFAKKYPGVNPRLLAQDNPKIMDVKCDIMTGFMRRLRAALDKKCAELGRSRVGINIRCNYSVYDNRLIGIDVERWAREGLVDRIISYPLRVREIFEEDVWADADREAIDLEKYARLRISGSQVVERSEQTEFEATPDSKGNPAGPKNQRERVEQFEEIAKKYNVPVYYDILPRVMDPDEYQRRAVEMYSYGAENFSFWDTYNRTDVKYEWNMVKRLGHKEELADMDYRDYCRSVDHNILKIDGMTVRLYSPIWGG